MTPFGNSPACRLESAAIIPDLQLHLIKAKIEYYLDSRCMRMFYDIGQGFFADAKQVMLRDTTDFPRGALHQEAWCYSGARQRPLACFPKRHGQIFGALKRW